MGGFLSIFFGSNRNAESQSRVFRASAQLDSLHALSRSMEAALHQPENAHRLIASSAQSLLQGQTAVLVALNPKKEQLDVVSVAGVQDIESLSHCTQAANQGILGQSLLTADTLVRDKSNPYNGGDPILEGLDTRNLVCTPIRFDGKDFGVLCVDSRLDASAFDRGDIQLLEVFASYGALLEQSIYTIASIERKADRLRAVFEVSRHLAQFTAIDDLLEVVVEHAVSLTDATSGSVVIYDDISNELHIRAERGLGQGAEVTLHSGEGITGWVFQHGESLIVDDVSVDNRYVAVREDVGSELAVPLRTSDGVVGVLNVDQIERNSFTQADRELLQSLADVSSGAIQLAQWQQRLQKDSS